MIQCYRCRWSCNICGQTFGKRGYLNKHREHIHQIKTLGSKLSSKLKGLQKLCLKLPKLTEKPKVKSITEIKKRETVPAKRSETVADPGEDSDWKQSPGVSISTSEKGSEKESDIEESGAKSDAESVVSKQEHVENQKVTLPLNLDSDSDIREIEYDIEQKEHDDHRPVYIESCVCVVNDAVKCSFERLSVVHHTCRIQSVAVGDGEMIK